MSRTQKATDHFPRTRCIWPVLAALFVLSAARAAELPSLAGHADAGTYRFYLNEEVLVTTHFTWAEDGSYQSDYLMSMAGQEASTSLSITADPTGAWTAISMETPLGPVSVERTGYDVSIKHKDQIRTVVLTPQTILFENFNPALMRLAIDGYDQAAGGKQDVSLFIVPAAVMAGTIERIDSVERAIAGRDVVLQRYVFGLPGVDVTLYVEPDGRIVFGDVPSQHGAYVREGYESLLESVASDSLLSQPTHQVTVDSGVGVPMRDGLALATDLYRPDGEGPFPVVLVRTPYRKEMNELQGRFFARRGYVYAVQDCRGRFSSPGEWEPFFHEADDGYDTIEWLAAQPWSNGKVGMIGASYVGWVQWWAASENPPHLTTIIPNVSPPDPYYNVPYENGAFFLLGAIWWADVLESEATGDITLRGFEAIGEKDYPRLLRHLPVIDLDKIILGKENRYWREWIAHPTNDDWWERASFLDHLSAVDIPVFHQSGWFDGDGIGSKLNYLAMRAAGHENQKLVLGPWGHTDTATRQVGERDFGESAIIDLQRDYLRWFDFWLKDIENGITREPLVSLFVMGDNRWLHGNVYPLPETKMTRYYLHSGGAANSSQGDGELSLAPPIANEPPDRFIYDPDDPTPSPHYYLVSEEEQGDTMRIAVEEAHRIRRAYYAVVDSTRKDILVYDTQQLAEPLTVAGPISAVLYAETSAADTDWFMRVAEVDSTGEIFWLTEGKIRARYANSTRREELIRPGAVYRYELDLWQTGITIPAGSRLRIEVASASFPLFSRNLNTGEHNETEKRFIRATQTVHHDSQYPSHVLLPVIPRAEIGME